MALTLGDLREIAKTAGNYPMSGSLERGGFFILYGKLDGEKLPDVEELMLKYQFLRLPHEDPSWMWEDDTLTIRIKFKVV